MKKVRVHKKEIQINANKVAIYIRWSTDEQSDGTTLEVQLEACSYYLKSQNWNVNESLIYIDDGYSGGNLDRPALTKLREDIQKGLIECVVVFKLDRLSRSVIDTVNLVLEEWDGITYLKSAREPVDTSDSNGKTFFYMLASFAEWERSVIKERTFGGKVSRASEGKNAGFKPPYGYMVGEKKGTFAVVKEEKLIVQRIFNDYLNGIGMSAIANNLNKEGIRFRKGKYWNYSTIRHIITNPIYIGILSYGKLQRNHNYKKRPNEPFWLKNDNDNLYANEKSQYIEAIIKDEIFNSVQEKRISKDVNKSGISGSALNSKHLLSSIIKCKKCGHSLTGNSKKKNNTYAYYVCRGKSDKGNSYCDCGNVRQDIIDSVVIEKIKEIFLKNQEINIIELLNQEYSSELKIKKNIIVELEKQITEVRAEVKQLEHDYFVTKSLSALTFDKLYSFKTNELTDNIHLLEIKKEELENFNNEFSIEDVNNFTSKLAEWESLEIQEQKLLIRQWVHSVVVYKDIQNNSLDINITFKWDEEKTTE